MKKLTPMVVLALLGACTTPADVTKPLSVANDPNAKVAIVDTADGFTVEVAYSRYQFIPETSAIFTACRSIALARASEEAKRRNREIQPINEQDIRVSAGRNILNARTACRAFVETRWR
jgi:hypothetical protein